MKKSRLLLIALISINIFNPVYSQTDTKVKVKKTNKINMSGALGKNLNVDGAPTPAPASGNIFYNATVGKKAKEPEAPAPTPVPTIEPVQIGTGSVDRAVVQRNQTKESYISSGMTLLTKDDLDGALNEFRKAQSVSNDNVVQRWIQVINNKKRIKEVNRIIESMNDKGS